MNCCPTKTSVTQRKSQIDESAASCEDISDFAAQACAKCICEGRPVSRKTILLMLKADLLEQAMHGNYRFCATPDCAVVYFDEEGKQQFTIDDLRIPVGLKAKEDPVPICYCFGFDESHIREEIARTGDTTIPAKISRLIREGLCACDSRNPSGMCCLAEVNKTVKLLKFQLLENSSKVLLDS